MSLVFAGSCAGFHHQYFKMTDMLIHHFKQNMHGLNLCATSYAPRKEVNEIDRKDEE